MPRPTRLRRFLYLLLAAILPLALLELLVVTLDLAPRRPQALVIWTPNKDEDLGGSEGEFRFHPRWLWEPRPGAMARGAPINEDGYRGPHYPLRKTPGRLRIAALGDSSTYGMGVNEEDGWVRQLEARLRESGVDAEVLNFGVVGFTLEQGYELYLGRVRDYQPDIVILAFGAINDSVRASAGIADRAKIDHLADPLYRARQFLQRYATFRLAELELRKLARGEEDLKKDKVYHRVPLFRFKNLITEFRDRTTESNAALAVISPPRRMEVEYNIPVVLEFTQLLEEEAASLDLTFIDVRAAIREKDLAEFGGSTPEPKLLDQSPYFIDPYHPSPAGHAIYADVVLDVLRQRGLVR